MKNATGVAVSFLAGSLLVCGGSAAQSPDGKPSNTAPIPQDREVTVAVQGSSLTVRSQDAVIHLTRPLAWVVTGLRDGQSVEIDFEVYHSRYKGEEKYVKGPFGRTKAPGNPVRGRFILDEKTPRVESGPSDTPGYFKYHVVLRDRNGNDLFALDPGVVVKNEI